MAIFGLIEREQNYTDITILTCRGYKSNAKNPRSKSRYREVTLYIPIEYSELLTAEDTVVMLEMWMQSNTPLVELYNRWHVLAIDKTYAIAASSRTTSTIITYKVHDKYNVRKLMQKRIKGRMPLFS